MDKSRSTPRDWDAYTTAHVTGKAVHDVYKAKAINEKLDPSKIMLREARDSSVNPVSTPIAIFFDVTGSNRRPAQVLIETAMKTAMSAIYDRKPVTDPQIMMGAIGDVAARDQAPLQVTQFESDIRIADQTRDIWLEGHGGGNDSESYTLPWYFMAMRVATDSMEKRGKKGYLFTLGDEPPPRVVRASELETVFGPGQYDDLTSQQLLDMVSKSFHVFHIMLEEGSGMSGHNHRDVTTRWGDLLGQRAMLCSDVTKVGEIIVSTIQIMEGESAAVVTKSWGGATDLVVSKAVGGLVPTGADAGKATVDF